MSIIVENSEYSKEKLSVSEIKSLNYEMNKNDFKDKEVKLTIFWKKENKWNLFFEFTPFLYKKQFIKKENVAKENIKKEAKNILKQLNCNHVNLVPKKYKKRVYTNGEGFCKDCGFQAGKVFESKINEGQVLKSSFGSEYVTIYPWKDTFVQFGGNGVVVSNKGSYRTAFFEAFPTIDGYSTFVRGEGENPEEAEKECHEKVFKMLECKNHEFTRELRGKHRSDGTGECKKCKLFSTDIFEPETKCIVCDKPTKNKFNKDFMCFEDYFKIPLLNHIENIPEIDLFGEKANMSEEIFNTYVELEVLRKAYSFLSEKDFLKNQDNFLKLAYHFENIYKNKILGFKSLFENFEDENDYPNYDDKILNIHLNHFIKNLEMIFDKMKNNEIIGWEYFLC